MGYLVDGKPMVYKTISGQEVCGKRGYVGIRVDMSDKNMPDLSDEESRNFMSSVRQSIDKIYEEYLRLKSKNDPEIAKETARNRAQLIDEVFSFDNAGFSFVEEIPNGYCSRQCCEHIPWFTVTTAVGRIKIGWRKSVIQIEWEECKNPIRGDKLFPDEKTTIGDTYIHAWSIEKAKEYVRKIIVEHS